MFVILLQPLPSYISNEDKVFRFFLLLTLKQKIEPTLFSPEINHIFIVVTFFRLVSTNIQYHFKHSQSFDAVFLTSIAHFLEYCNQTKLLFLGTVKFSGMVVFFFLSFLGRTVITNLTWFSFNTKINKNNIQIEISFLCLLEIHSSLGNHFEGVTPVCNINKYFAYVIQK